MRSPSRAPPGGCADRLAIVLLGFIGLYVLAAPILPGWGYFEREGAALIRVLVGFLFLFVASLVLDKNRARRRHVEVLEGMNMLLYGKNYRRDREAIRILLGSLSSEKEDVRNTAWVNLRRLTGQDFALDPEVWRSWWLANEKHFAAKSKRPEE